MSNKNWKEEVEFEKGGDGCCGWKGPDECPNDREFDSNHQACKECEKDAVEAMYEAMHEFETNPIL